MHPIPSNRDKILLVAAAPAEAEAIARGLEAPFVDPGVRWTPARLTDTTDLLLSGVGKANAAGAVAAALTTHPNGYAAVINLGIAGALPAETPLALGDSVLATTSVFADEGVRAPDRFLTTEAMNFPVGVEGTDAVPPDPALSAKLGTLADHHAVIATVSACSGRDEDALALTDRTGAKAEAMEGAAAALACARTAGVPFAELRVISNTCGNRESQIWDLARASDRLADLAHQIQSLLSS